MDISLTAREQEILAGLLAGFLERRADFHELQKLAPEQILSGLAGNMPAFAAVWRRLGWPQKPMAQTIIESGLEAAGRHLQRQLKRGLAKLKTSGSGQGG
jgi:hypothetical protein